MNVKQSAHILEQPKKIKILIHGKIKSRSKYGNVCFHSVQNLSSSSLTFLNIKIKIHRTLFYPLFCVGVKLGRSQ